MKYKFRLWCYRQVVNLLMRFGHVPEGTAVFRCVHGRSVMEVTGYAWEINEHRDLTTLTCMEYEIKMRGADITK